MACSVLMYSTGAAYAEASGGSIMSSKPICPDHFYDMMQRKPLLLFSPVRVRLYHTCTERRIHVFFQFSFVYIPASLDHFWTNQWKYSWGSHKRCQGVMSDSDHFEVDKSRFKPPVESSVIPRSSICSDITIPVVFLCVKEEYCLEQYYSLLLFD